MEEKNTNEEAQKEAALQQQVQSLLADSLETKAKERLSNVRLVNQNLYWQTIQALMVLKRSNKLSGKLTDEELKSLLIRIKPEKRDVSIRRR